MNVDRASAFGPMIPVSRELLDDVPFDRDAFDEYVAWGLSEAALWMAAGVPRPDMRVDVEAMRFVKRERRPLRRVSLRRQRRDDELDPVGEHEVEW